MYSEFHVNMRAVFSLYITNWCYEYNEILSFLSSQCKVFLYHAFLRVSIKNTSIGKIGFTEEQNQSDSWKQNNLLSVSSFIKGL